jgi:hypothetical protein
MYEESIGGMDGDSDQQEQNVQNKKKLNKIKVLKLVTPSDL